MQSKVTRCVAAAVVILGVFLGVYMFCDLRTADVVPEEIGEVEAVLSEPPVSAE